MPAYDLEGKSTQLNQPICTRMILAIHKELALTFHLLPLTMSFCFNISKYLYMKIMNI